MIRLLNCVIVSSLLLATNSAFAAESGKAAGRPNIVVILGDDMGYADLGIHGCADIPTPHIDSLAKNGVRCTNGYVSGPYCSPTRAGFLTGRYQTRFGHEFNPGGGREAGLALTETTLANRLKAAGYATALVGKWHLGEADAFHPQRRGFDEFFGFLGGAHSYFPGEGAPILRGTEVVHEREYLTDAFAREAVSFIDRHQDTPFFLYLAFNAVHTPMHAMEASKKQFDRIADEKRRTYAAMMTAMDDAVGNVLAKLRGAGLEQNTLIFFFSDNGGPTMRGTTINAGRNNPLRGSKRTTLEGGIRVPFLVQWKAKLPAGAVYNHPVIQLDILPTALTAAGMDIRPEWKLDGVDLTPFLTGSTGAAPHPTLYWRLGEQMAIRHGDWKLVRYDPTADILDITSDKPAEPMSGPKLYNLALDMGESNDQSAAHPDKARELQSIWDKWNAEQAPAGWSPAATNPRK